MPTVLRAVPALLAPDRCLACRARAAPPWCATCAAALPAPSPGCHRCAAQAGAPHRCWPDDAPIASTRAPYDYRGVVSRAIVTAKLTGAHAGWEAIGRLLATHVLSDPPDVDVVTWVPTMPARRRRRGVDHAQRLALPVGRALDVPVASLLAPVRGPGGEEGFVAATPLPGSEVMLVDDVVTTGRTAVTAATVLRDAGAGGVHLAVVARAGTHDLRGAGTRANGPNGSGARPRPGQ